MLSILKHDLDKLAFFGAWSGKFSENKICDLMNSCWANENFLLYIYFYYTWK